jgi:hypothetical protein
MRNDSPLVSPQNVGLKPINMKVSKNTTSRKYNPDMASRIDTFELPDDNKPKASLTNQKPNGPYEDDLLYDNGMWD